MEMTHCHRYCIVDEDVLNIPVWTPSSMAHASSSSLTKGVVTARRRRKFSIRTPRDDDKHARLVHLYIFDFLADFVYLIVGKYLPERSFYLFNRFHHVGA